MQMKRTNVLSCLAALAVVTSILSGVGLAAGPWPRATNTPAPAGDPPAAGQQAPWAAGQGGTPQAPAHGAAGGNRAPGAVAVTSWDALSTQVIAQLLAHNYTMFDLLARFHSVQCIAGVTLWGDGMRPMGARYHFGWDNSNEDWLLAEGEVQISREHSSTPLADAHFRGPKGRLISVFRAPENRLKYQLFAEMIALFQTSAVRTRRTTGGYTMTLTAKPGDRAAGKIAIVLTVTSDFRISGMQIRIMGGTTKRIHFTHQQVGGKWLLTGRNESMIMATFQIAQSEQYQYHWIDKAPLFSEVRVTHTTSGQGMKLTQNERYVYANWKTERRETPVAPAIAAHAANVPNAPNAPTAPATAPAAPTAGGSRLLRPQDASPQTIQALLNDPEIQGMMKRLSVMELEGASAEEIQAQKMKIGAVAQRKATLLQAGRPAGAGRRGPAGAPGAR